jgi:alpha-glucosidase
VLRPTFADFPADRHCYQANDDVMLGPSLLVAPVVEPGQAQRSVYLPAGTRWVSYWSGESFEGGQTVILPAPWSQPVMLIREGGIVALNVAEQQFDQRADRRGFAVIPVAGIGETRGGCIEDDGETESWRHGQWGRWQVRAVSDAQSVTLSVSREGRLPSATDIVELFIPASETRSLHISDVQILQRTVVDGWHRLTLQCIP